MCHIKLVYGIIHMVLYIYMYTKIARLSFSLFTNYNVLLITSD